MFKGLENEIKQFLREEKALLLIGKKNIFNNFSILKNNDNYKVTLFNKYYVLNLVQNYIEEFSHLPFYKDILDLLLDTREYHDVNKVINICYFELVMFNLLTDTQKKHWKTFPIIQKVIDKKFNRAKLFEINKSSIIFDKSTNVNKYQEIINKGFDFIEIPNDFSFTKLKNLTNKISELSKEKNIDDFNISLRIKKLGLYKTKGFYSKETNTMFLDPRYLEVWRHELAHYFVTKNDIVVENEEVFADNF